MKPGNLEDAVAHQLRPSHLEARWIGSKPDGGENSTIATVVDHANRQGDGGAGAGEPGRDAISPRLVPAAGAADELAGDARVRLLLV